MLYEHVNITTNIVNLLQDLKYNFYNILASMKKGALVAPW